MSDEVVIAILAKNKEYCLSFYLNCILGLDFDKKKIHLYIRTNDNTDKTDTILEKFIEKHTCEYKSVYYDATSINSDISKYGEHEWNCARFKLLGDIRQKSVDHAIKLNCHYFVVDCDNFITKNTLTEMFSNKDTGIIAPLLVSNNAYANFHYDTTDTGYFKNHENYHKVLNKSMKGLIKVNVVHCTYFIDNKFLRHVCYDDNSYRYEYVIFSEKMRNSDIGQYIINENFNGFLVLCDSHEYPSHISCFKHYLTGENDEMMFA